MSTILSFLSGRQITNNSGVPQSGARIYHYRENTTTPLTVWMDDGATIAHATPYVTCDAGGFVPLIYVDDTFDWSVVIKTSADVTLQTYDNLPKAVTEASSAAFAPPLLAWTQVTSSASPVALTVNDVGKAYEADTTGGNIEFDLPDAASVGNGKGFVFKKTASANSMIIDPNGSQTIDDVSTSLTITAKDTVIGIFSNGAEWYQVVDSDTLRSDSTADLTAGYTSTAEDAGTKSSGTFTPDPTVGNIQRAINNGAHTLAPPSADCTMIIQYTNGASAGAITTSSFTLVDGDVLTTTNGHDFFFYITIVNGFSRLTVVALQ